jgi:hypothetical protein
LTKVKTAGDSLLPEMETKQTSRQTSGSTTGLVSTPGYAALNSERNSQFKSAQVGFPIDIDDRNAGLLGKPVAGRKSDHETFLVKSFEVEAGREALRFRQSQLSRCREPTDQMGDFDACR